MPAVQLSGQTVICRIFPVIAPLALVLSCFHGLTLEAGTAPPAPQLPRDAWKDCAYNNQTIGCVDEQLADGLRIIWKDGLRMNYRYVPSKDPNALPYLRDRLGGLWQREVLPQGNTVLTNVRNGNRIFVPLRYPCKPPLKGEVGFCRY